MLNSTAPNAITAAMIQRAIVCYVLRLSKVLQNYSRYCPITQPSTGTTASTLITETTTAQQYQSTTAASITETTTAQHNQSTTADSPGDGGSVTAVIVVVVLAMATGCIITCAVVVWKRTRARKNYSIEMR